MSTSASTVGRRKLPAFRCAGRSDGFIRAAVQQGGLFDAEANVAGHFLPVLLANQRADLGVRIRSDRCAQAIGALGEAFNELGVDTLLNKDARAGGAAFAVDQKMMVNSAASSARSISASSKISTGDFPPSSSTFSDRRFHDVAAVAVPPVKETARTS